jgi:hypothetical protein
LIPRQLALSPVMLLAIRIEFANLVTVQRLHDPDPRQHRRAAALGDQQQRLGCGLPFRRFVLGLRKLRDVRPGILQRHKLGAAELAVVEVRLDRVGDDLKGGDFGDRERSSITNQAAF